MAKMRTDAMVQKYGLNDDQAKKLLDLNTRYADKLRPMGMGGQRGQRGQGMQGNRNNRPQRAASDSVRAERRGQGQRGNFGANREEMQKNMEAYNNELKTIMTTEQFEAYQKDEQSRRQGPNGPRRERPTQRQ